MDLARLPLKTTPWYINVKEMIIWRSFEFEKLHNNTKYHSYVAFIGPFSKHIMVLIGQVGQQKK